MQPITDEAGLLACAMYVDLNPIRAAMAESIEDSPHTSAYDRLAGSQGKQIDSAAFDLVPAKREDVAEELKNTPVDKLRDKRKAQRKNPTGKRILRDGWLAPLTLEPTAAGDPEASASGVRASDKGFLHIKLSEYLRLLRWTAKQVDGDSSRVVPPSMRELVSRLGIDLTMWRDLVWNFKKYFGKSACVGSPESMQRFAESVGQNWISGQHNVRVCFNTD